MVIRQRSPPRRSSHAGASGMTACRSPFDPIMTCCMRGQSAINFTAELRSARVAARSRRSLCRAPGPQSLGRCIAKAEAWPYLRNLKGLQRTGLRSCCLLLSENMQRLSRICMMQATFVIAASVCSVCLDLRLMVIVTALQVVTPTAAAASAASSAVVMNSCIAAALLSQCKKIVLNFLT